MPQSFDNDSEDLLQCPPFACDSCSSYNIEQSQQIWEMYRDSTAISYLIVKLCRRLGILATALATSLLS
ncbi:uncharacterized protein PHALS_00849 [Plasmopara halstedii]|uniref:Uncharacterized protein n=1 Tax=Plasmopara halstedii TaxID=4781 RepID=A0A0P1AUD0_PLAHL|nr:uncharacterized protein PHALS_00849 [Plasmopara halstedii]CEG44487.1 hypothetical protein PHALS_00849 [Plasmopara halstedii]|eukprot:XP_024580856.1 hypothetical protein PHALS_00849 [Plasmopara halstedii]